MNTTVAQEIDGLIVRLSACRLLAQRELQAAEQEAIIHPGCCHWIKQAACARSLIRDCTAEIDCLRDERRRLMPVQRVSA